MPDLHHDFVIEDFDPQLVGYSFVLKNCNKEQDTQRRGFFDVHPERIALNEAVFIKIGPMPDLHTVAIVLQHKVLALTCTCGYQCAKLCEHEAYVLLNIINRPDLLIFFDEKMRKEKMEAAAMAYGLQDEPDLESYFLVEHAPKTYIIKPKIKSLVSIGQINDGTLEESLLPIVPSAGHDFPMQIERNTILVFYPHKYYKNFQAGLFEVGRTTKGKLKSPVKIIDPQPHLWEATNIDVLKFYQGVLHFSGNYHEPRPEADISALKAIINNPLDMEVYFHHKNALDTISVQSLTPISLKTLKPDLQLYVYLKEIFYEVTGEIRIDDTAFSLKALNIRHQYFVQVEKNWYLMADATLLKIITFFKQNNHIILIHHSKFAAFKENILGKLENQVRISYTYLQKASAAQLAELGYDLDPQKIIYLSNSEHYILITPVMKYGETEVPVLSMKQIHAIDQHSNPFLVQRNEEAETRFIAHIVGQHPDFKEQVHKESLYLHKNTFLDENWFLDAFEAWAHDGIAVYGFEELTKNRLNPNKAMVSVSVGSGINWFEVEVSAKFGKQNVTLAHLKKSIKNKSKYVLLGDGSKGILPDDWVEKFSKYFNAGSITGEKIRIPAINFSSVSEMFEAKMLSQEAQHQLGHYQAKFAAFTGITTVSVPKNLNGTLREYQIQGLNWLNFLDQFGFGGCLADDMGLGKTIQIIAFILLLQEKKGKSTHLVVAPASLIFNWQDELKKFATSLKVLTLYGADRVKNTDVFDDYDIVLTSYGSMLQDIRFLKDYGFNYIFLDESQNIKNPYSQRYRAAMLLMANNRIVLTGTPFENKVFDIFGQISFSCPGLLGSFRQFNEQYSKPVDKFEDKKKITALRQKIHPFILRRTKAQVATELPEKTEMVIYCEMSDAQRRVYDAYQQELLRIFHSKDDEDKPKKTMLVLRGLIKLRQICNSPALLQREGDFGQESAKLTVLMEQLEAQAGEHKILVFSQFVGMLDLVRAGLIEKGIGFSYLTGASRKRGEIVKEFQENVDKRVFLVSLKAGGVGLNLTEADYVYLIDPWWNPAVENQAIDRIYRIGQRKNVVAIRLICPGTVEEKVMKLQQSKNELFNDLVKTDVDILKKVDLIFDI